MTNKIFNVLEEIKKLRVENSNKSNIVINPTRFASDIDTVAKATKAYTEKIYGSIPDHFSSHTSNYKDSIRTVDHLAQFKHSPDVSHSTYFSNFYGIPKIKEMSNNENTLYYEKGLGKQTEFDYAINTMASEMNKQAGDKEAGLQHIIHTLRNKTPSLIKQSVASVVEEAKAAKAATAASVVVAPAVTTAPVNVAPAFSKDPEAAISNMTKFVKGVNTQERLSNVVDAKIIDEQKEEAKRDLFKKLNKMKVAELEDIFKSEGLKVPPGKKIDLINQLIKYQKQNKGKFTI
jgi:hypothetical protein